MPSFIKPTPTMTTTTEEEEEEVLAELKRALNLDGTNDGDNGNGNGNDGQQQQQISNSSGSGSSWVKPLDAITIPVSSHSRGQGPPTGSATASGVATAPARSTAAAATTTPNNTKPKIIDINANNNTDTIASPPRTNYITSGTFPMNLDDGGGGGGEGVGGGDEVHDESSWKISADDGEDNDDDDEDHIHFLQDGADDMTYGELLELVERLYKNLKQADAALTNERSKRTGREKSLIKLAKELRSRKHKIEELEEQIDDLEDDLHVVKSERTALEERLDQFLDNQGDNRDGQNSTLMGDRGPSRSELSEALRLERQRFESSRVEHEKRVQELKHVHASQCEALCREILQANKETTRLQQILESERRRTSFGSPETSGSTEADDTLSSLLSQRLKSPVQTLHGRSTKNTNFYHSSSQRQSSRRDVLSRRAAIILLALFTLGLAIVGTLYQGVDTTEKTNIDVSDSSFPQHKSNVLPGRTWSPRDDLLSKNKQSRIRPILTSKSNSPSKNSPTLKEESHGHQQVVCKTVPNEEKSLMCKKGHHTKENVADPKSNNHGGGLFDGIHNAIRKIGSLIQTTFRIVVSFFKSVFEFVTEIKTVET